MIKSEGLSQKSFVPVVVMVFTFFLISPYTAWGQGPTRVILESASSQKLSLIVGKSFVIRTPEPVKRVSLGSSEIADALVLTARQISVTGKAPGVTSLTLWGLDSNVRAILLDLEISPDVSRIEETLRKILPEEKDVRVTATHDNITLSGTVSSLPKKEEVLKLVDPYFPKKTVDLLKVEPSNTDEVSRFEEMLRKTLPEERDIRVSVVRDNVIISGTVSKPKKSRIQDLAALYFPKKVTNLLEEIEVKPSPSDVASQFKKTLYEILPDEKDVKITPTDNGNVTLSGTVSSASYLSQVLALADSYFPKEKEKERVINLLEVGGVHQVMLEVRVAEMSRSLLRRLGFNFNYVSSSGKNLGLSLLNKLTSLPGSGGFPAQPLVVTDKITGIFRFVSHDTTWTFFIDALKEEGLLKVLAEPTLITLSGKTANFLAGGEFPVPVPQSGISNTITIEYKPFGVGLNFTPVVLSNKKISMQVAPEVSELDFSNAVSISGFVVPALTTRRVSTTIELADGQSFAIAGLLKDEVREIVSKFPLLGDIPVLGPLFRSSSFQKNETELVVIATPHLVKPLEMAKQTLPTDQFIEPNDFEFYILGNLEGKGKTRPSSSSSSATTPSKGVKLEGSFGHIVPKQ